MHRLGRGEMREITRRLDIVDAVSLRSTTSWLRRRVDHHSSRVYWRFTHYHGYTQPELSRYFRFVDWEPVVCPLGEVHAVREADGRMFRLEVSSFRENGLPLARSLLGGEYVELVGVWKDILVFGIGLTNDGGLLLLDLWKRRARTIRYPGPSFRSVDFDYLRRGWRIYRDGDAYLVVNVLTLLSMNTEDLNLFSHRSRPPAPTFQRLCEPVEELTVQEANHPRRTFITFWPPLGRFLVSFRGMFRDGVPVCHTSIPLFDDLPPPMPMSVYLVALYTQDGYSALIEYTVEDQLNWIKRISLFRVSENNLNQNRRLTSTTPVFPANVNFSYENLHLEVEPGVVANISAWSRVDAHHIRHALFRCNLTVTPPLWLPTPSLPAVYATNAGPTFCSHLDARSAALELW